MLMDPGFADPVSLSKEGWCLHHLLRAGNSEGAEPLLNGHKRYRHSSESHCIVTTHKFGLVETDRVS